MDLPRAIAGTSGNTLSDSIIDVTNDSIVFFALGLGFGLGLLGYCGRTIVTTVVVASYGRDITA